MRRLRRHWQLAGSRCINAHSGTLLFEYSRALEGPRYNGLVVELMDEKTVQDFWQDHSCGDALVGGLRDRFGGDYEKFFSDYDKFRYDMESHIPACLDGLGVSGKRVLEIGLGQGADSESLIRRGARWSGVDLTGEVLRPGGELVIMMYARWSLNYLVAIGLVRRAALLAAFPLAKAGLLKADPDGGMLAAHLDNANKMGLGRYLRLKEFIHYNTDGPGNPYSSVWDRKRIEREFPSFRVTRTYKRFMHAPPLPVHGLPGGNLMGWHLWAHLSPVGKAAPSAGSAAAQTATSTDSATAGLQAS